MTTVTETPNVAGAIETVESHLHPTPSWDIADHPMPKGREEVWRFTPLKRMKPLLNEDAEVGTLEWSGEFPEQVTVSELTPEQAREFAVEAPTDRIAALAASKAHHRTHIQIPADAEITEPIVFVGKGDGGEARDHILITVGAHAKATIVIRFEGSATYGEKLDVDVADGATLNLLTVQDWEENSVHGGQRTVRVGRDAKVKTITASLGGDVVRLQENSTYAGPGGEVEAYGVYFVDGPQHVQHRLFVDHNEPHTVSNVDYRGALQGKGAHSVWIGDVLIRKTAEHIETFESNKNLLLTEGCRADSVPNLEIETGEISDAGHASSTGRFDEEQLFYLRSRGIPEREARRLVVHGFFWDIIRRIDVDEIEEKLLARVEQELEMLEDARDEA